MADAVVGQIAVVFYIISVVGFAAGYVDVEEGLDVVAVPVEGAPRNRQTVVQVALRPFVVNATQGDVSRGMDCGHFPDVFR